jgi:multidrug resistance efflux pump
MPNDSSIPTPMPLLLRRLRYQALPIVTFTLSALIAAWIWGSQARLAIATGEVEAVRVEVQPKFDGVLEEIPRPVSVFDHVKSGQVVARIDTSLAEAEVSRLEQEQQAVSASPTTMPLPHQTRIEELHARINAKDIKAPISGTIMAIHRRPGEGAVVGKIIMVIAADQAGYITGYLREDRMVKPIAGMPVDLRTRTKPAQSYRSNIVSVGAQVEPIPARHWRNPAVAEWGLPIQIAMPPGAELAPGELIDFELRAN